jgi:hypothetical protein
VATLHGWGSLQSARLFPLGVPHNTRCHPLGFAGYLERSISNVNSEAPAPIRAGAADFGTGLWEQDYEDGLWNAYASRKARVGHV